MLSRSASRTTWGPEIWRRRCWLEELLRALPTPTASIRVPLVLIRLASSTARSTVWVSVLLVP